MHPDQTLKENIIHGTTEHPIHAMHFSSGEQTEHPDDFFVQNHWHNYIEILLIRCGRYQFKINLESQILKEGDICILNSGDLHQIHSIGKKNCHDVILFEPGILSFAYSDAWNTDVLQPFSEHALLSQNIIRPDHAAYPSLFPIISSLLEISLEETDGWYEYSKLKLLELMIELHKHHCLIPAESVQSTTEKRTIDRYKKVVSYIELHYQDPVTLQQLAEILPCNSQYLCRFFKEISGITPIQYLIQYRIEQACERLRQTSDPVSEVALDCGFENISYFIRKFKELKNMTPKEFRRSSAADSLLIP